jgi:pyruvate dehydrogenase kinase 2/3/4
MCHFAFDSGQHVALHDTDPEPGVIGLINTNLSPMAVARIASEDARAICMREYGSAPDVDIYGDPDFTFPWVSILIACSQSLLYYIINL